MKYPETFDVGDGNSQECFVSIRTVLESAKKNGSVTIVRHNRPNTVTVDELEARMRQQGVNETNSCVAIHI